MYALRAVGAVGTRKKLDEYHAYLEGKETVFKMDHKGTLLNSFDPTWWVACFTDLFFRGDFDDSLQARLA